jgi:hypothetical protein
MSNSYWKYQQDSDTIEVTEKHGYWFSVQDIRNCKKGDHDILKQLFCKKWFTELHYWYLVKLCKELKIDIDYEFYAMEFGKVLNRRSFFDDIEDSIERLQREKALRERQNF